MRKTKRTKMRMEINEKLPKKQKKTNHKENKNLNNQTKTPGNKIKIKQKAITKNQRSLLHKKTLLPSRGGIGSMLKKARKKFTKITPERIDAKNPEGLNNAETKLKKIAIAMLVKGPATEIIAFFFTEMLCPKI